MPEKTYEPLKNNRMSDKCEACGQEAVWQTESAGVFAELCSRCMTELARRSHGALAEALSRVKDNHRRAREAANEPPPSLGSVVESVLEKLAACNSDCDELREQVKRLEGAVSLRMQQLSDASQETARWIREVETANDQRDAAQAEVVSVKARLLASMQKEQHAVCEASKRFHDHEDTRKELATANNDRELLRTTNAAMREEVAKLNKWHHDSRVMAATLERDNDVLRSSTAELMRERDEARARGAALLEAAEKGRNESMSSGDGYHIACLLTPAINEYRKETP